MSRKREDKCVGIIKKNPNEVLYQGGKKHFLDIIKNTGDGEFLIWKQPEEDFNTNSKLIVMPGETALFVKRGEIVQEFSEGTYRLSTRNYPFISRLINNSSGGISAFNCVVYFFRKADSKELRWGLSSPINALDKMYGIHVDIRARGTYKVCIEDPKAFLRKLVGGNIQYKEQQELDDYFRSEFQAEAKVAISEYLNSCERELTGLDANLLEISNRVKPRIEKILASYGLKCVSFTISAMDVDKTKYEQIDSVQIDSIRRIKEGQSEAAYINALGDNWQKLQNANIMMQMAQNSGTVSAEAEVGIGIMTGKAMGKMAEQMFTATDNKESHDNDPVELLSKLKKMLDAGLIEREEYDAKKREVLNRM